MRSLRRGKSNVRQAFAKQAERLAQNQRSQDTRETGSTQAVEAKFVTPLDPVVVTESAKRLPVVPIHEAEKINRLKAELDGQRPKSPPRSAVREGRDGTRHGARLQSPPPINDREVGDNSRQSEQSDAPLHQSVPVSRTNPLFPPLPMYGPPTPLRSIQMFCFRVSSAILSFVFLLTIVFGAVFTALPPLWRRLTSHITAREPQKDRPFYEEECRRARERETAEKNWMPRDEEKFPANVTTSKGKRVSNVDEFIPTEGGPDPLCVNIAYYARRVGLDAEVFEVQTEDGFVIELWHIFNPREQRPSSPSTREMGQPEVFIDNEQRSKRPQDQPYAEGGRKYPVLMIHGLLQSAGAFCCNDDDSLAFYLAKSGYDVWLGNNRCGFEPKHTVLKYGDPRMWAWNIRQMGVMDLPALVSRVLSETGFPKLALIAHSQGTTQTLVALAKEQRPELGEKLSVFCALAPAAYAGPLIGKIYFAFMRVVSPAMFRLIFGVHAFIPLMMFAHKTMPPKMYSWMGYQVFSFLFNWSDTRWDRGLRNRMFQWAPSYVSSESMRWWLGRECFAKQKCILSTREEGQLEDEEDDEDDEAVREVHAGSNVQGSARPQPQRSVSSQQNQVLAQRQEDSKRGRYAWYDERFPPLAMWVCGADDLVDGRRLLRRFDRGREPHARVVHKKIIEGYEHLDVIWAMDVIEKVGQEVREVIWSTLSSETQRLCRIPVGCGEALGDDAAGDSEVVDRSEEKKGEHDHLAEEAEEYGSPSNK